MRSIYIILIGLWLSGCGAARYLPEGRYLYTGAEIKYNKPSDYKVPGEIKSDLQKVLSPKPNGKFLGMRIKLWIYNVAGTPKNRKGIRHWIRTRLGEEPVLYDERYTQKVTDLIANRLDNNGHFRSLIEFDEVRNQKKKHIKVVYKPQLNYPYVVDTLVLDSTGLKNGIFKIIDSIATKSLIKKGEHYNLDILKAERERIAEILKEKGYYFFRADYLIFEADTLQSRVDSIHNNPSSAEHNKYPDMGLRLSIKKDVEESSLQPYKVSDIKIYTDYDISRSDTVATQNVKRFKEFTIYSSQDCFRKPLFERSVLLDSGQTYSTSAHRNTLRKFSTLGTFKFANIRFNRDSTAEGNTLQTRILLTPSPKRSLTLELTVSSQSDGLAGPQLRLNLTNRNVLGAAEQLTISFEGGYQEQVSTQTPIRSVWWVGVSGELRFPYLLIPFNLKKEYNRFDFFTRINGAYRSITFNPLLRTDIVEGNFGYEWRETLTKSHTFYPVSVTYQSVNIQSSQAAEDLGSQLALQSLQDQFILGAQYEFTFNDQLAGKRKNNFYFKGTAESAGNLLDLLSSPPQASSEEEGIPPAQLLGVPFAQYARFGADFRFYHEITPGTRLATRLLANLGIPYGNSRILPFFKQYFVGGPNSLRAFPIRTLGPGSYTPTDSASSSNLFFTSAGDIKLEANAEYRFNIFKFLNGAVFLDAGNVWLFRPDADRPGGEFKINSFTDQLAVGSGLGLRVDISFIVVRFDVGIGLRRPASGWVNQNIWRPDNRAYNIAIGYPF